MKSPWRYMENPLNSLEFPGILLSIQRVFIKNLQRVPKRFHGICMDFHGGDIEALWWYPWSSMAFHPWNSVEFPENSIKYQLSVHQESSKSSMQFLWNRQGVP